MTAHEWQVDMGEALHLGLDCSMIAGTGAGKTMPFVMPLFVESDKMIIIISPLNALEEDQVCVSSILRRVFTCLLSQASRFRKMGLSAVAVNGETYSNEVHKVCVTVLYLSGFDLEHRKLRSSSTVSLSHPPTCV